MKRIVSLLLCAVILFGCCVFQSSAVEEENFIPYVVDFELTSVDLEMTNESADSRVSGLILSYGIELSITGSSLKIRAQTNCVADVVKSGFKNFVVQRKKTTGTSWSDYYDYGDLYNDSYSASVNTTLAVGSGYQYRVTCKHYAKKSLLVTQSISNVSNVVYI